MRISDTKRFIDVKLSRGRIRINQPKTLSIFVAVLVVVIAGCDSSTDHNLRSATLLWQHPLTTTVLKSASPAISGENTYASFADSLVGIDLSSGELIWKTALDVVESLNGHIIADGENVYVYEFGEWIAAFNARDGSKLWVANLRGDRLYSVIGSTFSAPIEYNGHFIVPILNEVVQVSKIDGQIERVVELPTDSTDGYNQIPRYADINKEGLLCVPAKYPVSATDNPGIVQRGIVYVIDVVEDKILWSMKLPPIMRYGNVLEQYPISCEVFDEVVVAITNGQMLGADLQTGEVKWVTVFDDGPSVERDGFTFGTSTRDDRNVYIGSVNERLIAVEGKSGEVAWKGQSRGSFGNDLPVLHDRMLFIMNSGSGSIWIYEISSGRVLGEIKPPTYPNDAFTSWIAVSENYVVVSGPENIYALSLVH